jgi:hypothetical protein
MNSGNIYLRNHGYQIASQPTETVISQTLFLSNDCFLEEVAHLRNFFIRHFGSGLGWLRRGDQSNALRPGVTLGVIVGGPVGDGEIMSSFHGHGVRNRSSATSSERLEDERLESDGTGHTHRCSALYAHQSIVWLFTSWEKRCLSISTTRAIRMRDQGAEKFGSLKDFEVCGVLEKESRVKG